MKETRKFGGKIYKFTHIYEGDTPQRTIDIVVSGYKGDGYLVRVVKDFWIPNQGWRKSIWIRRK
jgi:hypothetical protein